VWLVLTANCICLRVVAEGVNKSGPSESFFADLEKRCPNLCCLHLSNADPTAPLPASLRFLSLSESSLSPNSFPASRFDVETQTVILPRLSEVELLAVKLKRGALAALPASVERLRIRDTRLPHKCFEGLRQLDAAGQAVFSRLTEIDFSDNTQLTHEELNRIMQAWPRITVLKISGCIYSSLARCYAAVNLRELEVLEADGVMFNGNIWYICQRLGGTLRRLSVAGSALYESNAFSIASELVNLQSLDVSRCAALSDIFFILFANLRKTLRFLNVSSTNVTSDTVELLKLCMPDCEIVY